MNAPDILIAAADCIGERAAMRDAAQGERSMALAVSTFNTLTGRQLTERDGWIFMAILKLARAQNGRDHLDDYVDGAAYIALAGEAAIPCHAEAMQSDAEPEQVVYAGGGCAVPMMPECRAKP